MGSQTLRGGNHWPVFTYVRRCLTSRPALWAAAAACSALAALPGSILVIFFIQPVTILLLTGDLPLAVDLVPEALSSAWGLLALAGGFLLGALLYARVLAVLLWESDEEKSSGWRSSWRATKNGWLRVLAIQTLALVATLAVAAAVTGITVVLLSVSAELGTLVLLAGIVFVLVARTILRIGATLASRSALLDGNGSAQAAREARTMLSTHRRVIVAAWATLLAAGVMIWLGGRVVTPILQDTAFDFPHLSSYVFAREAAQLAFAIPLEALLLAFSACAWTAVYRGVETEHEPTTSAPLMPRALAALVVLAIVGNGIPAIVDVNWRNSQKQLASSIHVREIAPEDALTPRISAARSGDRTSYVVDARVDEERLTWTTTVTLHNDERRAWDALAFNVYPAAFARKVDDIPLSDDLPPSGGNVLATRLAPGTFDVTSVRSDGNTLTWGVDDTILDVELSEPLRPDATTEVEIALEAELPRWPARYGLWDDIVQLGNWIPTLAVREDGGFRRDNYGQIGDPFFAEVAHYDVTLDIDEKHGAVGSGELVEVEQQNGRRVWRFMADDVRDAAFAIGPSFRGLERDAGGLTVRSWYTGDQAIPGERLLGDSVEAVDYFSRSYGDLSFDDIDIVTTQSPLGGMEYPGLVYVSSAFSQLEDLPLLPDLVEHSGFEKEQRRYITGHELAHQWWYAEVGNDQIREPWLDEGFAEASTRLWLREEDGHDRTWKLAHLQSGASPEVGDLDKAITGFESNSDYSDAIYDSGGAVLLQLREEIGASRYNELMRAWFRGHSLEIGTIDGFIALARDIAGEDAAAFLEKYRG